MRVRWTAERWIAVGLIVLTGWYLAMAWRLPRFSLTTVVDAHVFPMALGCVQILMAVWLGLKSGRAEGENIPSPWRGLEIRRGMLLLLLCLVYIELMTPLGFVLATFGFLMTAPYLLGWRRWKVSLLVALLMACGIYYLFAVILGVVIPKGIMPF
jgi:putative tricarboxylic transport membrane protein